VECRVFSQAAEFARFHRISKFSWNFAQFGTGVPDPTKMLDISFLKTEPNQTHLKIQKPKLTFLSSVFKNRLWHFGDGFLRFLIRSYSSSNVIGLCHISEKISCICVGVFGSF